MAAALGPGGVAAFTAPTLSPAGAGYFAASLIRKRLWMKLYTAGRLRRLYVRAGLEPTASRTVGFRLPLVGSLTRIASARKP